MKTLMTMMFFILSAQAFATANLSCPAGTEEVMKCVDASDARDQQLALSFMDGAIICQSNSETGMILSLPESGEASELIPVRVISRSGATSYQADLGDVKFSLVRMIVRGQPNGTFSIQAGGLIASRSLNCN